MNASIISFESPNHAQLISTQYLKDEHSLVGNSILIDRLGVAAVKLAASLESFVIDILPNVFDFACSLDSCSTARRMAFLRERECRDDFTPKAYISCLSAYNSGYLWGMWIDLTQDINDIRTDIQDMLALSPVVHIEACEDWRIDAVECFDGVSLGEYESLERVSAIANAMGEHGQPFALYLDYCGEDNISVALEQFSERYRGCYESAEDYARDYYESTGMLQQIEQAGLNSYYIDFEKIAHDWECNGDFLFLRESYNTFHVFARC